MSDYVDTVKGANSRALQREVLQEALNIFTERNNKYRDLWRQYGVRDTVNHLRSKFLRVEQGVEHNNTDDEIAEDALDLINYAAFLVRNIRDPLVAEAPQRGDKTERWIKGLRDEQAPESNEWHLLDNMLDRYRLHADTGTSLGDPDGNEP